MDSVSAEIEKLFNSSLPRDTKTALLLHLTKPWVPGFVSVMIRPLKPGRLEYLGPVIFTDHAGNPWYFPSAKWWMSHFRISHPPDGLGCDPQSHANFLTAGGKNAEFEYANLLEGGSSRILGPEDFMIECDWWSRSGRPLPVMQ